MRDRRIDQFKGILIILVVVGHHKSDIIHDIVFLFHMPLFFVISGFLLSQKQSIDLKYVQKKATRMLIPYFFYLLLETVLNMNFTLESLKNILIGGRRVPGVYWYITVYIGSLIIFIVLQKIPLWLRICSLMLCYALAICESNLMDTNTFVKSICVPLNLDVCLLAVVYLYYGYFGKKTIRLLLYEKNIKADIAAVISLILIVVFCTFLLPSNFIDMKYVEYSSLIYTGIIPVLFGIFICRFIFYLNAVYCLEGVMFLLAFLGEITLPVMYLHRFFATKAMLLCDSKLLYVTVGVVVPVFLNCILCRYPICRKVGGFALPEHALFTGFRKKNERSINERKNKRLL